MDITHAPLRLATGAFILNSGLSKLQADPETAAALHGMTATAYPIVHSMSPTTFTKTLAVGEIALGGALLLPMVPSALAGTALTGFGAGLLGLYLKVPGLRETGSLRPTQAGTPIAKDSWLIGAGATLALQGIFTGAKRAGRKAAKAVSSATSNASDSLHQALPR